MTLERRYSATASVSRKLRGTEALLVIALATFSSQCPDLVVPHLKTRIYQSEQTFEVNLTLERRYSATASVSRKLRGTESVLVVALATFSSQCPNLVVPPLKTRIYQSEQTVEVDLTLERRYIAPASVSRKLKGTEAVLVIALA